MKQTQNTIFETMNTTPEVELTDIAVPTVHTRKQKTHKRALIDMKREKSAAKVLELLEADNEIFGFTKGQFSIIDLITATLEKIGPANAVFSTWTAGKADVTTVLELIESGRLLDSRWLVDLSLQRRQPELANRIRETFGFDSIRVARNHSKFFMLYNDQWKVVIRTSMNLNFNPRFEDFTIANDPELFEFLSNIVDNVWKGQSTIKHAENVQEINRHAAEAQRLFNESD